MKLSKEFASLLEDHRTVLRLREQCLRNSKKIYELWKLKAVRRDAELTATVIEKSFLRYVEKELESLEELNKLLDEVQFEGSTIIAQMEGSSCLQ